MLSIYSGLSISSENIIKITGEITLEYQRTNIGNKAPYLIITNLSLKMESLDFNFRLDAPSFNISDNSKINLGIRYYCVMSILIWLLVITNLIYYCSNMIKSNDLGRYLLYKFDSYTHILIAAQSLGLGIVSFKSSGWFSQLYSIYEAGRASILVNSVTTGILISSSLLLLYYSIKIAGNQARQGDRFIALKMISIFLIVAIIISITLQRKIAYILSFAIAAITLVPQIIRNFRKREMFVPDNTILITLNLINFTYLVKYYGQLF